VRRHEGDGHGAHGGVQGLVAEQDAGERAEKAAAVAAAELAQEAQDLEALVEAVAMGQGGGHGKLNPAPLPPLVFLWPLLQSQVMGRRLEAVRLTPEFAMPAALSHRYRLNQRLKILGFVRELCSGDGSCLFSALAQALHAAVRAMAVAFMAAHEDEFYAALSSTSLHEALPGLSMDWIEDNPFAARALYVEQMGVVGSWGDELVLNAEADAEAGSSAS
jgi:hypothetical protein